MKLMHALALQLSERLEEPVFLRKVGLPSPPLPSPPRLPQALCSLVDV